MKRLALLVAVIIGALAVPASALSYDESGGVFGLPGSQLALGTEAVPSDAVGLTCDVTVDLGNNDSVRPGSDITITTGTDSRTFADTESAPGDPGPVTISMVMGDTVTVTLTFGPLAQYGDNAGFSGTGTVEVGTCATPPTTTPVVVSPETVSTAAQAPPVATAVSARPAFTG